MAGMSLTRIRLQLAIYFCLHRGSLPENTARRQPRFPGQTPRPKNPEKYMSHKTASCRLLSLVLAKPMFCDRLRRVGKPLAIFCPLADIYRGEGFGRVRRWFAQWEKELCRNQG